FSVLDARNGGPLKASGGGPGRIMADLGSGGPVFGSNTSTEHWFGYVHDGSVRVDFSTPVNRVSVTVAYAGLFGLPLSQPTIIAHDRYGRGIGQASIDLIPTDTARDLTLTLPTSNIAWVEITAPFNSEPLLLRSV